VTSRILPYMLRAFAVALALLAPRSAWTQPASLPSVRTFALSLCNKTTSTVQAVLVHRSRYDEDAWILEGWYTILPAKCTPISGIPRGFFYYYAEQNGGERLVWQGDARRVCVESRIVERAVFPKEQCLTGERNLGFREKQNLEESLEIPLNPPPKR